MKITQKIVANSIRYYLIAVAEHPLDSEWSIIKRILYRLYQIVFILITLVPLANNIYDAVQNKTLRLNYYLINWILTFFVPLTFGVNKRVLHKSKGCKKLLEIFYQSKDVKSKRKKNFRKNVRTFIYLTIAFILISTFAYVFTSVWAVNFVVGNENFSIILQVLLSLSFPFRLATVAALVLYITTVCYALKEKIKAFLSLIKHLGEEITKNEKRLTIFKANKSSKISELLGDYRDLRKDTVKLNKELQAFYLLFFTIIGSTYPLYLMFLLDSDVSLAQIGLLSSWIIPYFILTGILINSLASVDYYFSKIPNRLNFKASKSKEKVEDFNIWREALMDSNSGCFTINLKLTEFRITYGILFTLLYTLIPLVGKAIIQHFVSVPL